MAELLGYEELSELTGRSVGALRVARSKGRLPEQDAPGPKWHRESLAAFLKEGTKVPAGGPSGAPEPRPDAAAPSDTPVASTSLQGAPLAADRGACPHPREERRSHMWGITCASCGVLIR